MRGGAGWCFCGGLGAGSILPFARVCASNCSYDDDGDDGDDDDGGGDGADGDDDDEDDDLGTELRAVRAGGLYRTLDDTWVGGAPGTHRLAGSGLQTAVVEPLSPFGPSGHCVSEKGSVSFFISLSTYLSIYLSVCLSLSIYI